MVIFGLVRDIHGGLSISKSRTAVLGWDQRRLSRIRMERDVKEVVAKMKESRERFGEMERDKTISHGQVRSTILIQLKSWSPET
ncbi:hypothetical protein LB506_007224 [Fusarium annulatum]|nr:hypothetical protein LB506_007224 [Fusarium annulatum]